MRVIYNDGGVLTCNEIYYYSDGIVCDDYRIVKDYEIDHIENDDGEYIEMPRIR